MNFPCLFPRARAAVAFVLLAAGGGPVRGQAFDWQTATPESQGFSPERLDAVAKVVIAKKTRALLVVRNDRIVYEWYADGIDRTKTQGTASLAKAVVGGLPLAVALTDGRLKLDDPAVKFVPAWKDDRRKSKVTLRHLGSHTSGLDDAEADDLPHDKLTGWKGDFWKGREPPADPFTLARDQAAALAPPGERLRYSNPGIGMLTYCVTASIRGTEHTDVRALLRDRALRPIGVGDTEWSVGYGKTLTVDGLPLVPSWGGAAFTPRAMARIGRLVLRAGDWDGKRILSREAVAAVTGDAGLPGRCGMGWWTNAGGRYAGLPKDAVWGAGAGDQLLLVIPSLSLVMVRNGQAMEPGPGEPPVQRDDVFTRYHDYRARTLFEPLVAAIAAAKPAIQPPLPPSPVIASLDWAAKDTIVRRAKGSDNWPLTWADDDRQYTAYGDGWGFEPLLKEKLGLGFARVEGGPTLFTGVNVRSPTGEQTGQGKDGKKASGLLMVDGVLYLWARNAGNSQLAWSRDRGATWAWADWTFTTGFGCPTFLNYGKNYAGARDEFVYVYSPDADTAYRAADRMTLARVPSGKVRDRDAYEFFAGLDKKGQPAWAKAVADRGAVFAHPGRCYRSGVTYNAGLRRYLWVQPLPGTEGGKADTRFAGGFAVYDAAEPWGPWTTAFFTERWDVGPGDSASFPTKWMSADGLTLYLAFSGDDAFSVRRATVTLRGSK